MGYASHTQGQQLSSGQLLFIGILMAAIALIIFAWQRYQRYQTARSTLDAPLLISAYTLGNQLTPLSKGILAQLPYSIMMAEPMLPTAQNHPAITAGQSNNDLGTLALGMMDLATTTSAAGRIILSLQLPVKSYIHIAGLGMQDHVISQAITNLSLSQTFSQVQLEGDFPDYFRLYCSKGLETGLLQVLTPDTMAFLVDYCQHTHWEIFEDTIYFSQLSDQSLKNADGSTDSTTLVQDAESFAAQVLPDLKHLLGIFQ